MTSGTRRAALWSPQPIKTNQHPDKNQQGDPARSLYSGALHKTSWRQLDVHLENIQPHWKQAAGQGGVLIQFTAGPSSGPPGDLPGRPS